MNVTFVLEFFCQMIKSFHSVQTRGNKKNCFWLFGMYIKYLPHLWNLWLDVYSWYMTEFENTIKTKTSLCGLWTAPLYCNVSDSNVFARIYLREFSSPMICEHFRKSVMMSEDLKVWKWSKFYAFAVCINIVCAVPVIRLQEGMSTNTQPNQEKNPDDEKSKFYMFCPEDGMGAMLVSLGTQWDFLLKYFFKATKKSQNS